MEVWDHRETMERYVQRQRVETDYVEQPALESVLPSLVHAHVVDLGAGAGDWAHRVLQVGAARVTAVEPSPVMRSLSIADSRIHWISARMEEASFEANSVDCVLSVRSFPYVESCIPVFARIFEWLRPGGCLVFSVEHPLKSANSSRDWIRDDAGQPLAWPIDGYLDWGPRHDARNGITLTKWHRPVAYYVHEVIQAGLSVKAVLEPDVTQEGRRRRPEIAEELRRRPAVLIVRADKV
ncbi:class I SAM-dependent methyltransferase [Sulfobacillus harzensis]|uniref:Class I SAM-dependent methyltransferase n=1 Tax=Sulfobacillus harzensis TaxID=2729629 RepID=A0A7Y0L729_9FIRM|nr:class I SAM-dependent methyltransferase [Sulfobacillus harzensis]NMP24430.1 class I SAM-dependent methyltransferase [Sulfobacillus harzensis]